MSGAGSSNGPILVTGAAGKTGRAILRRLRGRAAKARALAHRPAQREVLEQLGGLDVVDGDLLDPESLTRAASGVEAIYHICPNVHPDEVAIGGNVVAAARSAGAERIVYHSVLHPQIEAMPHHWAKLRVEELLFASGIAYTILQPAPYMQNVLAQWDAITGEGAYPVPYSPSARIAMVDLDDVAEAAVRVLSEPGHAGATYELCGRHDLSQDQIAATLGHALGRPVRAVEVPLEEWTARARAAGLSLHAIETLAAMFRYYGRHGMAGSSRVLEWLLGRPPVGFGEFVERIVAAGERGLSAS